MMRMILAVCAAALLTWSPSSNAADIYITESLGTARNITIIGKILPGDDEKFRTAAVRTIRDGNWIGIVKIFSPGGNVGAAIGIGEQVRVMRASTVAPTMLGRPRGVRACLTDIYQPPSMQMLQFDTNTGRGNPNCDCASACFLVWAAGVGRQGDVIGIHRPYFNAAEFGKLSSAEADQRYEGVIASQKQYLGKMGIPPYFVDLLFAHSSQQIRYLTKQELQIFPPLPPAIGELRLARCGERPNTSTAAAMRHFNCTQSLYEEASREGNAVYLREYGR